MKTNLLKEARRLPIEERIELVGAIWDTVAEDAGTDTLPLSAAQRLELDRRLADLEADPDGVRCWEEVSERLEQRR